MEDSQMQGSENDDWSAVLPKILVVDDKQENLLAVSVILRSLNCEVVTVSSGKEAIQYCLKNSNIALILLDIQMPVLDGYGTAKAIREIEMNDPPPIVFLTAGDWGQAAIDRAFEIGAIDHITKPISPKVLESKAGFFIELFNRRRQVAIQGERLRASFVNERNLLLENALDAVIGMNQDQKIIDWNKQAELIFGWSKNEVIGQNLADIIVPPEFRAAHDRGVKHFLASGEGPILRRRTELTGLRRSGETFPIELTVIPINVSGNYLFYSFARDISERKRSESLVQKSKEESARFLQESTRLNQVKDEFLATLSHELRTPLNVILGNVEILASESETLGEDEKRQALSAIQRNANLQTQIIQDLLDVSSIITGKVAFKPSEVSISEIARSITSGLARTAEAKGVKLICDDHDAPQFILADPTRLHQIFWNLISNALKFSSAGGVVNIRISQDETDCLVEVMDTGLGIEPEFLPHVFDRFSQEDSSMSRKFGGLGLGLSIVRHLTEIHGGSVEAESKGKNQGSKFTVRLPLRAAVLPFQPEIPAVKKTSEKPSHKSVSLSGVKILLVEDSIDNQLLISRILTKVGAEVQSADSAQQARATLSNFLPDVILSDIGMPDETGIEFMKKLRSSGDRSKAVPAIALTAYVRPEERELILQAGFDAHVGKPVAKAFLFEEISRLLRI